MSFLIACGKDNGEEKQSIMMLTKSYLGEIEKACEITGLGMSRWSI